MMCIDSDEDFECDRSSIGDKNNSSYKEIFI
jgi:hypothetical protein